MHRFKDQTVVAPYDFSNYSASSMRQIMEWSDDSTSVHLIHVVVPTPVVVDVNPPILIQESFDEEGRDSKEKCLHQKFMNCDNVTIHCVIGDPGTKIVELADNLNADLIVMPTHGRTGLIRLFLGSVAERVLRFANCPVLVLKGLKLANEKGRDTSKA